MSFSKMMRFLRMAGVVMSEKNEVTGVLESYAGGIKITKQQIVCKSSCTLLGDSLNNYGVYAPNLETGELPGSAIGTFSNHPVTWANDMLAMYGMQIDVVSQRAVAATTLDGLTAQIDGALTDDTEIAWVHSGINTLQSTQDTPTTIKTKLETHIGRLAAGKKVVIWDAIDPVKAFVSRATQAVSVNAMAKAICQRYQNVFFNDTFSRLVDTTSDTLYAVAAYLQADNMHKTTSGAVPTGYGLADLLLEKVVITPFMSVGPNVCPAFYGAGKAGTETPGSGTITNSPAAIPSGWNVAIVAGTGNVAVSDIGVADQTRFVITNSGGVDMSVYIQRVDSAALAALFSGGDIVRGSWFVNVRSAVGVKRAGSFLRANGNVTCWGGGESGNETSPLYPTKSWSGRRSTLPLKLPASLTSLELAFLVKVAAAGSVTIDLSLPELVELT